MAKKIKKVLVLDSCHACPYCHVYGRILECSELSRKIRKSGNIFPDCPLDDAKEED